jgi:hypothetical protein
MAFFRLAVMSPTLSLTLHQKSERPLLCPRCCVRAVVSALLCPRCAAERCGALRCGALPRSSPSLLFFFSALLCLRAYTFFFFTFSFSRSLSRPVDFANITIETQFTDYASSAFVQQMGRRCVGEKVIRVESGCCGAPCSFRNGNSDTFYGLVIDNYRGRGSLEICSPFTVLEYVPESIRSELMRGWSTAAPECHTVSVSDITSVARSLFDSDSDSDNDADAADAADADADADADAADADADAADADTESDSEPAPSPAPSPAPRRTTRKPYKRDFLKACSSHEYNRSKKLKK